MADDGVTSESDGHMSEIDNVEVSDDEELLDENGRAGLPEHARVAFERLARRSADHKIYWKTQQARTQAWIDKYELKRQKLSRSTGRVRNRNAEILVLRNFIETLRTGLRELREEVNGACDRDTLLEIIQNLLSLQIPGVRFRTRAQTLDSWRYALTRFFAQHPDSLPWCEIYSLSCRENNIDAHPAFVHPYLILRGPRDDEVLGSVDANEEEEEPGSEDQGNTRRRRNAEDQDAFVFHHDEEPTPQGIFRGRTYEALRIFFEWLLVFPGEPVHVLTRLDPFLEPQTREELEDSHGRLQLLRRLHIGKQSCSLTYAIKPSELLAPLLVSKQWAYLGIHLFYGKNTFCFSSFSEWGAFAKGIGHRIQRIRYMELLWKGSQMLVNEKTSNGKYVSKRTQPLLRIPQAIRLQTLEVYLQESSRSVMRRQHEPRAVIRYQKDLTHNQPNMRLMRAMRTLQGIDNIYCLRGLQRCRFFDFDIWLKEGRKQLIRDHSFLSDVNAAVRVAHTPDEARSRRFNMLRPCPPGYAPGPAESRVVGDALKEGFVPPQDGMPTPSPSLNSDTEVDSDSDSDDDSSSGSGSPPTGSPNGSPGGTAMPPGPQFQAPPTPESTSSSSAPDEDVDMAQDADDEDDGEDGGDDGDDDDDDAGDGHDGQDTAMSFALDAEVKSETDEQVLSDAEVVFTGDRTIIHDLTRDEGARDTIVLDLTRGESLEDAIELNTDDEKEEEEEEEEEEEAREATGEGSQHAGEEAEEEESLFVEDNPSDLFSSADGENTNTPEPQSSSGEGGDIASGVLSPDVVSERSFSPSLAQGTPTSSNGNRNSSASGSPSLWVSSPPDPAAQGSRPTFTSPTNSARPSRPETLNTPSRSPPQQTESPNLFTSPGSNESSPSHSSSNGFSPGGFARGVLDRVQGSSPLAEGGNGTRAGSRESPIEIDEEPSSVHRTPRRNMVRRHGFQMSTSPTDMLRDMTLSSIQSRLSTSSTSQDADADQTDPNVVRQGDPQFRSPFWRQRVSTESSAASGNPKRVRQEREDVETKDESGDDDSDEPSPKRARDSLRKDNWEPDRDGDSFME